MAEDRKNDALAGFDEGKRKTLTRLLTGSAFVAPIVTSFAMDALTVSQAHAGASNSTLKVSDRRLKTGIVRVAKLASGLSLYRFKYLWSDIEYVGVMAQEAREIMPAAVTEGADGFLRVDYARLGLEMLTYPEWQKREAADAQAIAA
jgi:hypothetical protein